MVPRTIVTRHSRPLEVSGPCNPSPYSQLGRDLNRGKGDFNYLFLVRHRLNATVFCV